MISICQVNDFCFRKIIRIKTFQKIDMKHNVNAQRELSYNGTWKSITIHPLICLKV
jgi:hypothetical protein